MQAKRRDEEDSAHSGRARDTQPHASDLSREGDTNNRYDGG